MIFLHHNVQQRESVNAPGLVQTRDNAPTAPSRALNPVLIASALDLKIALTHSKKTAATWSNRYFFSAFRSASHMGSPQPSSQPAVSNRQFPKLETHLTRTKQSIGTVSNRQKTYSCVSANSARTAANFQPTLAPRIPRA